MSLNSSSAHTDEEKAMQSIQPVLFSVYSKNSNQITSQVTNLSPTLDLIDLDVPEAFSILASVATTKAMGIDGIGPLVLKTCADGWCSVCPYPSFIHCLPLQWSHTFWMVYTPYNTNFQIRRQILNQQLQTYITPMLCI